ncbi:calcium/sodium antiporter [Glycocaulis abyssi]|uniref:Calcium/sodium antiporter n=1 Tax=Glycocaulis abyssi TaxID=1433403 RepID=A0ABV9NAK5_9PROT
MTITMTVLFIGAGLALLVAGGESLVRGASGLARRLGISPLLIGLVVVGFGTSTPELTTSMAAALRDAPEIAVGNVIGSNIANILLILGLAALLRPIRIDPRPFRRDGSALAISALAGAGALAFIGLERWVGAVLLTGLAVYLLVSWLTGRDRSAAQEEAAPATRPAGRLWVELAFLGAGFAGVIFGAGLLVDGAVSAATALGVPQAVIGLTIVAVGTSLPELAASLSAARRGEGDIAFGNIVGSNIFNILGILGVTALVSPLQVTGGLAGSDLGVMLAASALLLALAIWKQRLSRLHGAIFLALYAAYIASMALA